MRGNDHLSAPPDVTPNDSRAQLLAYVSLASSMALVGSYVGMSKLLVAVFPVFLLAWMRFALAAVAMARWLHAPTSVGVSGATVPAAALSRDTKILLFWESFLGNFLFSICMLYGIRHSTALAAGVVMAALPAVVAVMSFVFLREQVQRRVWAGVACAVVGIGLVAWVQPMQGDGGSWWGVALLTGAVLCEASYVVIGKRLVGRMSPTRLTACVNLWGLVLVTPLGLWQAWSFDFAIVEPSGWGLLLFYSMAASVWSVWLWMTGLRHVPAARAGVFTIMLPITAAAVGVIWLGERFSTAQALAFGLALSGLLLATWPSRHLGR